MSDVTGVASRVRFRPEDDETAQAVVARDTNASVRGDDANWRETKTSQHEHVGCVGALHLAHAALEGLEGGELLFGGGTIAGLGGGALAVGGFALGLYSLHEAHEHADAQRAALKKDAAHVAIVANLELPKSYASKRLGGDFKHVGKEAGGDAFKMTEKIKNDPKGRAVLQLHADRGMHAARDCAQSGMTREAFLAANPKIAKACADDAAFKEGFEAYFFAHRHCTLEEKAEMEQGLRTRDGWYAADNLSIRV